MKLTLASSLAFTALVGGAMWGVSREEADPAAVSATGALPVRAIQIQQTDGYLVRESYAGRVVSRRSSALGFERGGRLEQVGYDEGDRVEQGTVLAALDTRALRAQRRENAARVEEIRARLELARVTVKRRQQLHDAGHLSPQELDEATFSEQALRAELLAAQASLENLDVALDLSEIQAPYAGSITARHVDEGTVVGAGEPILELIEDRALEVRIGVPPEIAAGLEPGTRHELEIDGRPHPAVLHAVLATVEPDTRTVAAIFHLEESADAAPRAGALGRVSLERRVAAEGFWLPISALAESRRGLWSAYAVVPDEADEGVSRADRRQLEIIHPEAERAFVRGTLRDGEWVVATGVHRLAPGLRVRVTGDVARP